MGSLDFARVERAIRYLDSNATRQPTLADVAQHVGLSEHHFQRLFTRWVGISPKRFLQFQTVEHAKEMLRRSHSVLDTTYEAGLSSGGRLHDLFVTLEAVTPGEFKARGRGISIHVGFHDTPFGECVIGLTDRGVCGLSFLGSRTRAAAIDDLSSRWPGATIRRNGERTRCVTERIFHAWDGVAPAHASAAGMQARSSTNGETPASEPGAEADDLGAPQPLAVLVRGTNFQVKVWEALLRIPAGAVSTYEDIAAAVGHPSATRSVGTAISRNPVAYLIPCHRVIRNTGVFGGYRWGAARKIAILMSEERRAAG